MFVERGFELISEFITMAAVEMAVLLIFLGIIVSVILARVEK